VDALQAEVLEAESELKYLQEQLADFDLQKQEHEAAIQESKRVMDVRKHSTKSEIFALKGKIISLIHKCVKSNFLLDQLSWTCSKISICGDRCVWSPHCSSSSTVTTSAFRFRALNLSR
jgi:Knl1 RWD C-terminal domain